ncbi:hypothetical protein KHQ88_00785 [Mycoplasmatota bacterium]|nr:hypothetical protein KHQ88_00785 [Mycoplasmatota bacterium]
MILVTIRNIVLLIFETLKYMWERPKMLLTLLVALILYVPLYYYLVLMESVVGLDWTALLIRIAVFLVGVPLIFTLVNFVFIEMAKQEHTDKRIQFSSALMNGIVSFFKAFPFVILWVVFRYVLAFLKPFFSPPRLGNNEFSSINREFSRTRSGRRYTDFYAVAKWQTGKNVMTNLYRRGLHDGFMMMYTGLTVEDSYFKGVNKALKYYQKEAGFIRTAYDARSFNILILLLPTLLTVGFFPYDVAMMILFVYLGVVWIYVVIVKQLLVTNLYLWMKDFETSNETKIYDVDKPVYLYRASNINSVKRK